MEKHISDIKQEEKVQKTSQRTRRFLKFISEIEVPVCIHLDHTGKLTVVQQKDCVHTKLEYIGTFVMGTKRPSLQDRNSRRSFKAGASIPVPGHALGIEEFAEEFCKFECVKDCAKLEDDPECIGLAFFTYLKMMREAIVSSAMYKGRTEEEVEEVLEEVELFITRKIYHMVFPHEPTEADLQLFNQTQRLAWVQPSHFDIPPAKVNEVMWSFAIKALKETDDCTSPAEKLACLVECLNILVNVFELCGSSDSAAGADDIQGIIIYIVIKALPLRMHSNLNYIMKFREQEKMLGQNGFCLTQMQTVIHFIETMNHLALKIPEAEFTAKMLGSIE